MKSSTRLAAALALALALPAALAMGACRVASDARAGEAPHALVAFVAQPTSVGCLAACAVALARVHGATFDALDLLRAVPVYADGPAVGDVAAALRARGLNARAGTLDLAALEARLARGRPTAVLERTGPRHHAIVVAALDRATDRFAVMDPAAPARRTAAGAELREAWVAAGRVALWIED